MAVLRVIAAMAALLVFGAGAARAASQDITCPPDVRAEVTSPLPAEWVATAQSSRPSRWAVEAIGGQPSLVCMYIMFGTEYRVWRRPPAQFPSCDVTSYGFNCHL